MHELNPEAIDRLRDLGGQVLVQRMVELFIKNVPARVLAARQALDKGDASGVEHAVHSIKSSAGNIGAESLMDLAGRAERAAEGSLAPETSALIEAVDEAVQATCTQLQKELEDIPE